MKEKKYLIVLLCLIVVTMIYLMRNSVAEEPTKDEIIQTIRIAPEEVQPTRLAPVPEPVHTMEVEEVIEDEAIEVIEVIGSGDTVQSVDDLKAFYTIKDMNYYVDYDELLILMRIVEAESGGEDLEGKILVANVIFNRIKSNGFPNTIEEVVFHKLNDRFQFSPLYDQRYYSVVVTESTTKAVEMAIGGQDLSQGALYFMNPGAASAEGGGWIEDSCTYLFTHGLHEFYKDKE